MIIVLTCRNSKCKANGIAIPVEDPADLCVCGACETEITDKQEQK